MPAPTANACDMGSQSGLADILNDLSFTGLPENSTTMALMGNLKAASASQNFQKAFHKKVNAQISQLREQAKLSVQLSEGQETFSRH